MGMYFFFMFKNLKNRIIYNGRKIFENKFPTFIPPHHQVAIKYSRINTKLGFYLMLILATHNTVPTLPAQSAPFVI
jgi:hypothetical protein